MPAAWRRWRAPSSPTSRCGRSHRRTATPEQAQEVHALIRARIAARDAAVAQGVQILYGGSVKPQNAREIFAKPDIDGGLIGGAALVADDFLAIIEASV